MSEMDFPQFTDAWTKFTNSIGVVYQWNGYGWVIGFYDTDDDALYTLGDLLDQIRILLQDTDTSGNEYRYSTEFAGAQHQPVFDGDVIASDQTSSSTSFQNSYLQRYSTRRTNHRRAAACSGDSLLCCRHGAVARR